MKSVIPIIAIVSLTTTALAAEKDWNFGDGKSPERWSLQNSDYALCDAGLMQSPIDLGQPKALGDITVTTNYGSTESKLSIAEEKLQLDFPAGMGMQSGEKQFNLLQVHFHTPSEHAIDGERLPLVAHFVHATDQGELGVLGILFEEGEANPALAQLTASLANGSGSTVNLDISEMIPDDLSVFRYMGSLTTPPCSEGVNWHVASQVMEASADQISEIRDLLGPTARSIQPLGNRLLVAPAE
jgi:carbonic anhydrase